MDKKSSFSCGYDWSFIKEGQGKNRFITEIYDIMKAKNSSFDFGISHQNSIKLFPIHTCNLSTLSILNIKKNIYSTFCFVKNFMKDSMTLNI
jgi:hypothetical protein